ncbi:MAG: GGDEF domain-containing protein [Alphaproteobacteria bacterium]
MTAMIICCFIDVAVFRYAARRSVLTPATARLLLAWVFFYASSFVAGGFLALSSNHPDAAIAVMAGLTCATVRNASDFSVSPAVGAGSVLPSILTAFAVPVMAPAAWQDPFSTVLTLAAVLAMVGYTMLHSIRRAVADRSTVAIARLDPLTKLLNRRAFIEGAELRFVGRGEEPFGLLFIDLNGFKAVNDLQGHRAGDLLLQAVAAKLGTRGELECVARIGAMSLPP